MCLNPGYVQLTSTRVLNLRSGTVNRWKLKKISEGNYYQLKEQGFINTRESKENNIKLTNKNKNNI
jgi:hypothetical protein